MLSVADFEVFNLLEYTDLMRWMNNRFDDEIFLVNSLLEGDVVKKKNKSKLLITLHAELTLLLQKARKESSPNKRIISILNFVLKNLEPVMPKMLIARAKIEIRKLVIAEYETADQVRIAIEKINVIISQFKSEDVRFNLGSELESLYNNLNALTFIEREK